MVKGLYPIFFVLNERIADARINLRKRRIAGQIHHKVSNLFCNIQIHKNKGHEEIHCWGRSIEEVI